MLDMLPRLALSVRQPWAWAIVAGHKPVENRSWRAPNPALNFRGPVAIHAARGMTRSEFEDAADFMRSIGVVCPDAEELLRGGIVGTANVVDIVKELDTEWFFGPRGLVMEAVKPVPFIPCVGQLGFFEWKRDDTYAPPEPARWMKRGLTPLQREMTGLDATVDGGGHG